MKNLAVLSATLLVFVSLVAVAPADTFFSGVVDVNGTVAGGNLVLGARNIGNGSNGVAYNNIWSGTTGGVGGIPINGAKITASGFIPVNSALVGNNPMAVVNGFDLVAVYAFEGVVQPGVGSSFLSNFNPDVAVPSSTIGGNAGGIVKFFDRRAAAALSLTDPTTWVPNSADLSQGLVGEVRVDFQADAYRQGPPGGTTTQIPIVINPSLVNTVGFDIGDAFAGAEGDLKLAFTDLFDVTAAQIGSLFQNLLVQSAFNDPNPFDGVTGDIPQAILTSLDLLVNLDQESILAPGQPVPDIAALNALFDAVMDNLIAGNHPFSNQAVPGDAFDNVSNLNIPGPINGDSSLLNVGGLAIPGGQFITGPEPAAVAVWCLVGMIGATTGLRLKKLKSK